MSKLLKPLWLLFITAMAVFVFKYHAFESNILKLLPKYQSEQTNQVVSVVTERINKQVVVMAEAPANEDVQSLVQAQAQNWRDSGLFDQVIDRVDWDQWAERFQSLNPYKHQLLSIDDRQAMIGGDHEVVLMRAKERLYGLGGFDAQQLINDPLFTFERYLQQWQSLNTFQLNSSDGSLSLTKGDRQYHFVFLTLSDSAFSPEVQQQVAAAVSGLNHTSAPDLKWSAFGAVLYAEHAYQQAKGEISTVGVGSLIGILLLFLLVFRSLKPLLVSVLSMATGMMVALAVTLWVFGEVHLFALLFGATMTGVSIDYCFHYLIKAQNNRAETGETVIKGIQLALVIGFLSSSLVYLGFIVTGYEVLSQVTVFSVVGLCSVLIQVLLFFPRWLSPSQSQPPRPGLSVLAQKLANNPLARSLQKGGVVAAICLLLGAATYFSHQPNDDVRALQSLSPTLKAQEQHIRDTLDWPRDQAYLLLMDQDLEQLLIKEHQAVSKLRTVQADLVGVSDLIPPEAHQKHNLSLSKETVNSEAAVLFFNDLGMPLPVVNSWQTGLHGLLENGSLGELLDARFMGKVQDQWALMVPLGQAGSAMTWPDGAVIHQAQDTSMLFQQFRVKSTQVLLLSVLLLWLVLAWFKYGLWGAFQLVSVPVMAGMFSLLMTQWLGYHVSLFSVLALLLVFGMGIDYVVFLHESKQPIKTVVALMLSATTTVLAFGLLMLSQVAVIQSFGFTVGLGILMVLLMAPLVIKKE